jgi:hypothetical protein
MNRRRWRFCRRRWMSRSSVNDPVPSVGSLGLAPANPLDPSRARTASAATLPPDVVEVALWESAWRRTCRWRTSSGLAGMGGNRVTALAFVPRKPCRPPLLGTLQVHRCVSWSGRCGCGLGFGAWPPPQERTLFGDRPVPHCVFGAVTNGVRQRQAFQGVHHV